MAETGAYAPADHAAISPDMYLSSTLSFVTVRGMQSSGLITCAKHYVLYEQEPICEGPLDEYGGRTDCHDVSAEVDGRSRVSGEIPSSRATDKTFKELYLPSFAETVRAGTGAVMW